MDVLTGFGDDRVERPDRDIAKQDHGRSALAPRRIGERREQRRERPFGAVAGIGGGHGRGGTVAITKRYGAPAKPSQCRLELDLYPSAGRNVGDDFVHDLAFKRTPSVGCS